MFYQSYLLWLFQTNVCLFLVHNIMLTYSWSFMYLALTFNQWSISNELLCMIWRRSCSLFFAFFKNEYSSFLASFIKKCSFSPLNFSNTFLSELITYVCLFCCISISLFFNFIALHYFDYCKFTVYLVPKIVLFLRSF